MLLYVLVLLIIVLLIFLFKQFIMMNYLKKINKKIGSHEKNEILGQVLISKIYKFVIEKFDQKNNDKQVLSDLLQIISEFFEADEWSLLLTPEDKKWTFLAWSFKMDKKPLDEMALFLQKEKPETVKRILKTKEMFYIKDTLHFKDWREVKEFQTLSWIGIPIILDGNVYGILNLDFYKKIKKLSRAEKKLINLISKEIPLVINHIFNLRDLVLDSYKDILTEVYNRKILNEKSLRGYKIFFFIDINEFKRINDNYGHLVGDEILKITAKRLKNIFKEDDIIVRYGGDEFLICLKERNNLSIEDIKERIKKTLFRDIKIEDLIIKISVSVGEFLKDGDESLNAIIEKTDELMYKDKRKI
ncbi:MAG: sensor domain-containing diguanylate cyclase [Thermosipho sp. (in: Bacteria)]|nr:sensor domain-containing diguanylate cyclase [Thermosipho sp. (in: thermotogales)]